MNDVADEGAEMTISAQSYKMAHSLLGIDEIRGDVDSQEIVQMFADSGHSWVKDDETPWCAAFVGSVLHRIGVDGTNALNAKSYLAWGADVSIDDAEPGDICVFWRNRPDAATGHVAFFDRTEGDKVYVLGGNQGDTVSIRPYPLSRLISIRRAPEPTKQPFAAPDAKNGGLGAILASIIAAILAAFKRKD